MKGEQNMAKLAIPLIAAGVIMLIITLAVWLKNRSFKDGTVCTAVVSKTTTGKARMNGRNVKTYGLLVDYTVDGVQYQNELPCTEEEQERATGRKVEIVCNARNPEKITYADASKGKKEVAILLYISLGCLALGAVGMVLARFAQ